MARGAFRVLRRILVLVLVAAVLLSGWWAYTQRQTILDHFAARNFTPSPQISELADSLALTSAGERIFYAAEPTLDASQRFNEQCSKVDHTERGHVLGCYAGGAIHLFNVTDPRLDGIVEVTAAHELLHAAFARLDGAERETLSDRLLEAYHDAVGRDSALEERMDVYRSLSSTAFANELHSVFGSEVSDLPEWLEEHYRQWFTQRSAIIDRFNTYRDVFDELQQRAIALQEQMEQLRDDVQRRTDAYDASVQAFNADAADFRRRNEAYEFSDDRETFDRIYAELEGRQQDLERELEAINEDIARYEEMRGELQELSQLSAELDQQLDSELAPPSTRPSG